MTSVCNSKFGDYPIINRMKSFIHIRSLLCIFTIWDMKLNAESHNSQLHSAVTMIPSIVVFLNTNVFWSILTSAYQYILKCEICIFQRIRTAVDFYN